MPPISTVLFKTNPRIIPLVKVIIIGKIPKNNPRSSPMIEASTLLIKMNLIIANGPRFFVLFISSSRKGVNRFERESALITPNKIDSTNRSNKINIDVLDSFK